MKKSYSIFLTFALIVSAMFISCASTPTVSTYDIDVQYDSETPAVSLDVVPSWGSNWIYGDGFSGFSCTFKNNTDRTVRIVWDQSSLNYNGNSYVPFLDGQKYMNADSPMSPAAITKNNSITKAVYSSAQPYYESGKYGGWRMLPMKSNTVELVFCVRTETGEQFVTATVNAVMAQTDK
ncbi:hypothetical protein [Treponema sp.]|uniref:hypothetical protein n=1 Tax=Treponema sp. TaxID=166 RepID=UPI00298E6496|nr:hypothetical protein [Treponema sp.]MCQ2240456.1 hypothetical protein [Treponema sp.]